MTDPASTNPAEAEADPNFEQALEYLEAIVRDLEAGHIGLAESLARYEQGVKLLRQCYTLLERAERRIELLSSADSEGRAVTEALPDEVVSLAEKAQSRSRRRSKRPASTVEPTEAEASGTGDVDEPGTLF